MGVSAWGLERREVEKRIYVRKGAAHGFRNLSAYKVLVGFEQPITELKTKFDKFVNTAVGPAAVGEGHCPSRLQSGRAGGGC